MVHTAVFGHVGFIIASLVIYIVQMSKSCADSGYVRTYACMYARIEYKPGLSRM